MADRTILLDYCLILQSNGYSWRGKGGLLLSNGRGDLENEVVMRNDGRGGGCLEDALRESIARLDEKGEARLLTVPGLSLSRREEPTGRRRPFEEGFYL